MSLMAPTVHRTRRAHLEASCGPAELRASPQCARLSEAAFRERSRAPFAYIAELSSGCAAVLGLLSLALVSQAAAQPLDPGRARFEAGRFGYLSIPATRTLGPWRYALALQVEAAGRPVEDTTGQALLRARFSQALSARLGLGRRGEVRLTLPVIAYQQRVVLPGNDPIGRAGLRDMWVEGRARLYESAAPSGPDQPAQGYGLALRGALGIPTGRDVAFAGAEHLQVESGLIQDFSLLLFGVALELSWLHRVEPQRFLGERFRDELRYAVGFKYRSPKHTWLRVLTELRGAVDAGAPFARSARSPLEASVGLRLTAGDWVYTVGAGAGIVRGIGTPVARGFLQVGYQALLTDQDRDGVPDSRDECLRLAEDRDGFEDEDGCPEPDNDGDFVFDDEDKCPTIAPAEDNDQDFDGCPDR